MSRMITSLSPRPRSFPRRLIGSCFLKAANTQLDHWRARIRATNFISKTLRITLLTQ